ncbi:hypothetical protein AALO_G00063090, partial [Alosa alosa]
AQRPQSFLFAFRVLILSNFFCSYLECTRACLSACLPVCVCVRGDSAASGTGEAPLWRSLSKEKKRKESSAVCCRSPSGRLLGHTMQKDASAGESQTESVSDCSDSPEQCPVSCMEPFTVRRLSCRTMQLPPLAFRQAEQYYCDRRPETETTQPRPTSLPLRAPPLIAITNAESGRDTDENDTGGSDRGSAALDAPPS